MAHFKLRHPWGRVQALLLPAILVAACGDDSDRYYNVYGADGGGVYVWRDAAADTGSEGGMLPFASIFGTDGGARYVDGSLFLHDGAAFPWMLPDGAVLLADGSVVLPDGQVLDLDEAVMRYRDSRHETDVGTCEVSEEDILEVPDVSFVEGSAFDIAIGPTGFGVAYRDESCGKADALFAGLVGATGTIAMPEMIRDDCKQIESVAMLWTEDGWRTAWTDNAPGSLELSTQPLDAEVVAIGERLTLTDNTRHEEAPVMADIVGRPMLAWIESGSGGRRIVTRMLDDAAAESIEVVPETSGHAPVTLALAQMGTKSAAVAWVEEVSQRGMWLQRLDGDGAPVGSPIQLTAFAGGGSTVDLAPREDGGAAVYSVVIDSSANDPSVQEGHEVRFQRLDETGAPRGGELKIVSGSQQGVGASIARLGGGYAITYRTRLQGGVEPEVRIVFVTKEGNVFKDAQGRVQSFLVAPATYDGSQTKVELSIDGILLIGYVDGNAETGNTLTLLRRRLNCM